MGETTFELWGKGLGKPDDLPLRPVSWNVQDPDGLLSWVQEGIRPLGDGWGGLNGGEGS